MHSKAFSIAALVAGAVAAPAPAAPAFPSVSVPPVPSKSISIPSIPSISLPTGALKSISISIPNLKSIPTPSISLPISIVTAGQNAPAAVPTLSSVLSSDPKTNITIVDGAVGLLGSVLPLVSDQVTQMGSLVQTVVGTEVVPQLQSSLEQISGELELITEFVSPIITQVLVPAIVGEISNIPTVLTETGTLVSGIEQAVNSTLTNLSQDGLSALKGDLALLLSVIQPLVTPIINMGTEAAQNGSTTAATQAASAVTYLTGLTTLALPPLQSAVSALV